MCQEKLNNIDLLKLKTFLEKMLEKDPAKRSTITELKDDPWLNKDRTPLKDMKFIYFYLVRLKCWLLTRKSNLLLISSL